MILEYRGKSLRAGVWLWAAVAIAACTQAPPSSSEARAATPAPSPRTEDASQQASALPAAIARGLSTDERVLDCAQGTRDGVSRFNPEWVETRRTDLNGDGREDWLVKGKNACLQNGGVPYWWAYAADPAGARLILSSAVAQDVQTDDARTNGFRDLRLKRGGGEAIARYDGQAYALPASESVRTTAGLATAASDMRTDTVAGALEIAEEPAAANGQAVFRITLAGKELRRTGGDGDFADFPVPRILQRYPQGIAPFDETIVFQQNMRGNACDGGPLWILGLRRDGSHAVSEPIDFCGGKAPQLAATRDQLTIVLPGGPLNRGEGTIPSETWHYRDGKVSRDAAP